MKFIKLSIEKSVATLSLNRPDMRNAFNSDMIDELTQCFYDLQRKDQLRLLLLKGEGESFCAGADLNWMKAMVDYSHQENMADSEKLFDMFSALENMPFPVLTRVHGHVMGGGLGLMAASDICIADDKTQFCFSEVRLGLAPAVISSFVLKKLSRNHVQRYFLTAEVFSSQEAQDMGLIIDHGQGSDLEKIQEHLIKKITQNGPHAVRATKKLLQQVPYLEDPRSKTSEVIANLRTGEEGQEGLKAFLEKRKPKWLESQDD